jgi:hypothetical protein
MQRLFVALFALSALFITTAGCGNDLENQLTQLGNSIEDSLREGYNFSACSEPVADATECTTCCTNAGFDVGATFNSSECGCSSFETNSTICEGSTADLDTCSSCCEGNGFSTSTRFGSGDDVTCECSRASGQPN